MRNRYHLALGFVFIQVFMASVGFAALGDAQRARFLPDIETINEIMKSSSNPKKVMRTLIFQARVPAFNVQGLARVYADQDSYFDRVKRDFKKIEDLIGQVTYWESQLGNAEGAGNDDLVEEASDALKKVKRDFLKELRKTKKQGHPARAYAWMPMDGEISKGDYYLQHLGQEYSWQSYQEDKRTVINYELGQIRTVENEYAGSEFGSLEGYGSIHSLRKDARWILIEMRRMNGLYTFRPDNQVCDIDEYANLVNESIANNKYGKLPHSPVEEDPCLIQQCLYLSVVKLVKDVGNIKDKLERLIPGSQKWTPGIVLDRAPEYAEEMQKIYGRFDRLRTWQTLRSQLRACQ